MGKPGDKMRKGQREGEKRWETGRGLGIWKECRGRKGEVWEFGKFFSDRGSELAQSQVVVVSPRHPPTYQLRTRPM